MWITYREEIEASMEGNTDYKEEPMDTREEDAREVEQIRMALD